MARPGYIFDKIADRRKVAINIVLTAALSMVVDIFMALLLQLMTQQEMLIAQATLRENEFVCRAKQKWTAPRKAWVCWQKPGRTDQWWINLWEGQLVEEGWEANLRMTGHVCMKTVVELRPYISPDARSPNRTALSAEKKLTLTLYFLKDMGSLSMTANTLGVARSTVSVIVSQVCKALTFYVGPKYISLPKTKEEMRELVVKFE